MISSRTLIGGLMLALIAGCSGGGGGSLPIVSKGTPTLVSIMVVPVNASISLGTGRQFTATALYSDASKRAVTAPVTWSSSNGSVAGIDPSNGSVLSLATGTTLITAVTGSFSASTALKVTSGGAVTGANVLPVSVNGSRCSPSTSSQYPNKPCVSVTLCSAGTTTCQTIDDILLDTGSYGLRLFHQVVTVPLSTVTSGSGALAECVQYGDGSSDWGPVASADVVLGGEPAVTVPIHIINQSFASPPSGCRGALADTGPTQHAGAGFNGILGVGLFAQDCGVLCTSSVVGMYYSCTGNICTGTNVPLQNQVQNPVAALPADSNGVILSLPSVGSLGAVSAEGSLILGIGTRSNNAPWAVTTYGANSNAEFKTVFNGHTYTAAFIDSGSNGLFFPSAIAQCGGWYCPPAPKSLLATNKGASGTPSADVSFSIADVTAPAGAFDDLGGYFPGMFDWGLPFFFGRDIYVGIEGASSPLGPGPYWAY